MTAGLVAIGVRCEEVRLNIELPTSKEEGRLTIRLRLRLPGAATCSAGVNGRDKFDDPSPLRCAGTSF
jgi:hypothetical protein